MFGRDIKNMSEKALRDYEKELLEELERVRHMRAQLRKAKIIEPYKNEKKPP